MQKKVNPKRLAVLLAVLVSMTVGGLLGFTRWEEKQQLVERERALENARAAIERRHADELNRVIGGVRLAPDYAVPRPETDERTAQLLSLVNQTRSKYIVFPLSGLKSRPGLDLTARIAIARQLARMIEAESGIEVPDPALVFQAYGEPRRMLPEQIP